MAVDVSKIPNNNKFDPVREAILKLQQDVTDGVSGVATVNSSDGNITITNSGNITVGTVGETITIGIDDSTYLTSADLSDYLSLSETGLQTIAGDITISGDLTVSGTTTFIDTDHLNIGDNIITLNADLPSGTAPTENAGIEINRGSSPTVDFLWNETSNEWDLQTYSGARIYRYGVGGTTLTIEAGSTAGDAVIALTPNTTGLGGVIKTTNARPIAFQPNSTTKVIIASDGNMNIYEKLAVGKTTAASTYPLEVDGAVLAQNFNAQMTASGTTYTGTVDQYFGSLQIRTDSGGTISLGGSGTGTVQNNVFIKDGDLDVNGDVTADNFIGDGSQLTNLPGGSADLQDVTDNGATTTRTIQVGGIKTDLIQSASQASESFIDLDDDLWFAGTSTNVLTLSSKSHMVFVNDTNSNGTTENFSFYTQGTTDANATKLFEIQQGGDVIAYGNIIAEDAEVHVGDVSGDNWTRIKHAQADGYGFDWTHNNATVIVNEQGTTNEALVLGDVNTASTDSGLFGISYTTDGGANWTKKLDLRGNGDLYVGSSGTTRVLTTADEGSGNGLDADTVDGQHASAFASASHTHDDRYYTESEIQTFFNRGYLDSHAASNLAVGWYTIATNTGNRALGEFQIWDTASSDHQSVLFNASHHYGNDNSNDITVLANSRFSGTNFRYIRIKDGGTYDGAALQVYIDGSSNSVNVAIVGGNAQTSGWVIKDWIPDATDPGDLSNYSSFGVRCQVDLDLVINGGIITTGEIYSGGTTSQFRVLNTEDEGSGNGLDADTVDGLQASQFVRSDADDTMNGVLTILDNDGLVIRSVTNGTPAKITFSDHASGSYGQQGEILFAHSDTASYGSGASFTIKTSESTSSILADGKLLFKEGLYLKPASGTGAGTQVISSTRSAEFAGSVKITESGTAQNLLMGNQDSGGVNKPAMVQGVNGYIRIGYGNSWSGEGGTFTPQMTFGSGTVDFNSNDITGVEQIYLANNIVHAGDTNTYLQFHAADQFRVVIAGAEVTEWGNNYMKMRDSDTIRLGEGSDFRMWHDGTSTVFRNYHHAGGNIYWQGEDTEGTNHALLYMINDVSEPYLRLFSNGAEKLRTVANGVRAYGRYEINDNNTYIEEGSSNSVRLRTNSGYVDIGPMNTTWCHVSTDRGKFYFNKQITVDSGIVESYNEDLSLGRAGSSDRILIRATSIGFFLDSAEDMRLENDGDLHVEGDIIAYSSTISDKRLKDDVETIPNALDKVKALRGVEYTWNKGHREGQRDLGLIAQEVEEVLPEIVREKKMPLMDDTEEKYKTVDYEKVVGVLVEAIKEQQKQIDELNSLINK